MEASNPRIPIAANLHTQAIVVHSSKEGNDPVMAVSTGVARCFGVAIILLAGILASLSNNKVLAQCEGSIPGLVAQCKQYVSKWGPKEPPSPECCAVVKNVDIPCVCKMVTKEVEQIVSMEKVYVARTCGLQVLKGMKCGST